VRVAVCSSSLAVCGSALGSVRLSGSAAVCGSAAVYGSVAMCGSVWQCDSVYVRRCVALGGIAAARQYAVVREKETLNKGQQCAAAQ
jgi:hypothetical protein